MTQNGCVRIMSQSKYPNPVPTGEVIKRLQDAAATSYHEFWADDLSILDRTVVDSARIHGPKQVTDVYLLALAVRHSGRFATFDGAVPLSAVLRAGKEHLSW
jgi:uncharacterized protein